MNPLMRAIWNITCIGVMLLATMWRVRDHWWTGIPTLFVGLVLGVWLAMTVVNLGLSAIDSDRLPPVLSRLGKQR